MPSLFDDLLGTDLLANIFGYLKPEDILRARLNNKMREAAKKTTVPPSEFHIDSVGKYNLTAAMTTALPNLQQLSIRRGSRGSELDIDVEVDPHNRRVAVNTAAYTLPNIDIISCFSKLRSLKIINTPGDGRVPALFRFQLLQKLTIVECWTRGLDLEMLAGLPMLKELYCAYRQS